MGTPEQEMALVIVNQVEDAVGTVVRQTVNALKDKKLSLTEGLQLSFACLSLASTIAALVEAACKQGLDQDLLWVLEHSDRVLVE